MLKNLFIPEKGQAVNESAVWQWYLNILEELEHSFLFVQNKKNIINYYREAGLLKQWRQPFFRWHYARTFASAAQFLFGAAPDGPILDLGCGSGTQSIFFALLGADVIGLDLDEEAIATLERRKAFYEQVTGKRLKIIAHKADALTFDYKKFAPIRGIYSMFAFNLMKPSRLLLERLSVCTGTGGRLAIFDGNCASWLPRLVPERRRPDCLTPIEFEEVLANFGFKTLGHQAGCVLPPFLWSIAPAQLLRPIDELLGKSWHWAISHQILAEKQGESPF